ncbi:MAG: hypothetical protein RSB91_03080 [Clostridia bacterium]
MDRTTLEVNNNIVAEIDVTPEATTASWQNMGTFMTEISESLNEQTQQYFLMADKGFATNEVTGMAPQFTVTGKKVQGDAACEYLYGLRYKIGLERKTQIRLSRSMGTDIRTVSCAVTVINLTCEEGESNGNVPMSATFAMNGQPVVGTVAFAK